MPEQEKNSLLRFFSRPLVGILGSLASMVGVILAIVFYKQASRDPELAYTVHPVRTLIVQGDRPSELRVEFMGEAIEGTDIVGVQVAIWNQGNGSIRPEQILRPVEIRLTPPARVLQAVVRKASRDVADLRVLVDPASFKAGRIPISWSILERNDGGTFQLIYAGPSETDVTVSGIVERSGSPLNLRARMKVLPPAEQYNQMTLANRILSILVFIVVGSTSLLFFTLRILHFPERAVPVPHLLRVLAKTTLVLMILSVLLAVGMLWFFRDPVPPFGF